VKSTERHNALRDLLSRQEFISAAELCRRLSASEATIRRDLIEMEAQGVLQRVHGGALSLLTRDESLDLRKQSSASHPEKVRIGRLAAEQVEDGSTVILGGGSTVVEVARNLQHRSIHVITNSIPIAQVFWESKRAEVVLTGGYLYPRTGALLGPLCERTLDGISADLLVMGIGGVSEHGLSDTNTLIVGVVRKMIEASSKVLVAADHTKFGRDRLVHLATLAEIDMVISDSQLKRDARRLLESAEVPFRLA
jgi:DeoR/GlpR family transcriptional regulator of sugar metabolism